MPEKDEKLAAALKQAKSAAKGSEFFFAVVIKGGDSVLLVDKKKVSPKDIADAKKRCGGTSVVEGRCFGADGKLVFETRKEPPSTLATALKEAMKRDAGVTLAVDTRQGTDADKSEMETQEEEYEQFSVPGGDQTLLHEFGHVLGMDHTQKRPDANLQRIPDATEDKEKDKHEHFLDFLKTIDAATKKLEPKVKSLAQIADSAEKVKQRLMADKMLVLANQYKDEVDKGLETLDAAINRLPKEVLADGEVIARRHAVEELRGKAVSSLGKAKRTLEKDFDE
jgi:hypothetical protein